MAWRAHKKGLVAAGSRRCCRKFDRAKPDFAPIAAKLSKADAQAVLIIASGSSVVDASNAIRGAGSAAQIVTACRTMPLPASSKSLGANARGVIVTQVYPMNAQ